jgi:hypothetical protein
VGISGNHNLPPYYEENMIPQKKEHGNMAYMTALIKIGNRWYEAKPKGKEVFVI